METSRMPVLFVGHGSPMNAIEDNPFSRAWHEIAGGIPRPRAIVCVSAHWETRGPQVTAMAQPRTIHDFGGFPQALYEMQYPAPGAPDLARRVCDLLPEHSVQLDQGWGLDHGAWSVLCQMYPQADIPTIQLSLDRSQEAAFHYALGQQLQALRDEGVLVIGSGNVVHNLRVVDWNAEPYDWALAFDGVVKQSILEDQHEALIHYERLGRAAVFSINSAEHYLPLLYVLGLKQKNEPVRFFAETVFAGSISMRCVQFG